MVEEERRRERNTGETLSVFVEKESPLWSGREGSGSFSPYFGSGVAAWPFGLSDFCNCMASGRYGASVTVVDTAQTGKNAWPPAENSSVLVGARAQMSERSVSGRLRLPGTFHGLVRSVVEDRQGRENRGDAVKFCQKVKPVPVGKMKLLSLPWVWCRRCPFGQFVACNCAAPGRDGVSKTAVVTVRTCEKHGLRP